MSPRDCGAGTIIPYLGPGLTELSKPVSPDESGGARGVLRYQSRAAAARQGQCLGRRATYRKHQASLDRYRPDDGGVRLLRSSRRALHRYLASLRLPMIVDTWYDGAMRAALGQRSDWGEVQGITRAGIGEDRWYRFYDAAGAEADRAAAEAGRRLLYKPHGSIAPARNFLISDADYVEVLDGDRHPDADPGRREGSPHRAQLSLHRLPLSTTSCCGPMRGKSPSVRRRLHYAIVEPETLTKNEIRFFIS